MGTKVGHPRRNRDSAVMASAALLAAAALLHTNDAAACGACYASTSESTVVNDHRMAFSIGKQQTVLWDSISYSGNPREFAYVLPAKPGARLEPSNEAFFTALDASTRPIIMGPQTGGYGGGYGGDYYDGDGSGGGCGCGSSATSADSMGARNAGAGSSGGYADAAPPPVTVVDQATVGPYETVTVRSTEPDELEKWLRDHGFKIPQESSAIIAEYVALKYDFIAMRLQPGQGVRAMTPIRIVSPGTDLNLPLRLMQIGAGAKVGITLYIVGEGRYRTTGFPDVPLDLSKLIWDYGQNRSNYQELSLETMAKENGRAFITEYADRPSFDPNDLGRGSGMTSNPGLLAAYAQACPTWGDKRPPPPDAGPDTGVDSGVDPDAGDDGGTDPDAGDTDAGVADASVEPDAGPPREVKTYCDDLDVAFEGMAVGQRWVTRVRANLPNAALADTLRFEAHPQQEKFDNIHQTTNTGTIPPAQIARMRAARAQGTYALIAMTAFVMFRLLKRKKR